MAELADASDLKSAVPKTYGFESRLGHQLKARLNSLAFFLPLIFIKNFVIIIIENEKRAI